MTDYIADLTNAIHRLHGCEATHVETVAVEETFEGQTMWQGDVEVFEVQGHPKATRAYAWSHSSNSDVKGTKYVAVLGLPPVDSAQLAVRAAIVAQIRAAAEKATGGQI